MQEKCAFFEKKIKKVSDYLDYSDFFINFAPDFKQQVESVTKFWI